MCMSPFSLTVCEPAHTLQKFPYSGAAALLSEILEHLLISDYYTSHSGVSLSLTHMYRNQSLYLDYSSTVAKCSAIYSYSIIKYPAKQCLIDLLLAQHTFAASTY